MQTVVFDSIKQAAGALDVLEDTLKAARNLGCPAFVHGRIKAEPLLKFMEENAAEINKEWERLCPWDGVRFSFSKKTVARMRKDLAKFSATAAPARHFVGREIARAVNRELSPAFAAHLASVTPDLIAAEVAAVRERILANS